MKHWFLIATIIVSGLFIAKATYDAGLKRFAYAIGVAGTVGWVLIGFYQFFVGGALLLATFSLVLASRHQMRKHQVGPFAAAEKS